MRRTGFAAMMAVCGALSPGLALADSAAVERGEQVVAQWCRDCHLYKDDKPDPKMAPPYEAIVLRDGRDRAYFQRFMKADHFPMTTFRLYDDEKADVVEWLMALQKAERK